MWMSRWMYGFTAIYICFTGSNCDLYSHNLDIHSVNTGLIAITVGKLVGRQVDSSGSMLTNYCYIDRGESRHLRFAEVLVWYAYSLNLNGNMFITIIKFFVFCSPMFVLELNFSKNTLFMYWLVSKVDIIVLNI